MRPPAWQIGLHAPFVGRASLELYLQGLFLTEPCGSQYVRNWDFRDQYRNRDILLHDSSVNRWHPDQGTDFIIVWSNKEATEICEACPNGSPGRRLPPFPHGAVVLIDNDRALHRVPQYMSPDRLFVRLWDVKLEHLKKELRNGIVA